MVLPVSKTPDEQFNWYEEIHAWEQSNLSQSAYSKSRPLAYHRFLYWRNNLTPISDKNRKTG